MRTFLAAAATAVALLAPAAAHADQCALLHPVIAELAETLAKKHTHAMSFCEPCGDKAPGPTFEIKTLERKNRQLYVNGRGVDLAYFYVQTAPNRFENLGIAANCGAEDVSAVVKDGKPSGPVKPQTANGSPLATRLPPPPRPPSPGMSMPRATAPDDLVGTWTVKTTTWLSSCAARPSKPDETWFVDLTHNNYTITTSDNSTFEGAPAPLTHGMFTHSLKAKLLPSSTVLKISHSIKDRFWGTIVRAEPSGGPNDPICVMQLNVSGTRQP